MTGRPQSKPRPVSLSRVLTAWSVLWLVVSAPSTPAWAESATETCIAQFDAAQRARREGRFREAHSSLLACGQPGCPAMVRADCAEGLQRLEAAQPTVVLQAADAAGHDLTDVTVEVDGVPLVPILDGRAVAVDPGPLRLVFRRPPWEPVTVDVVIKEAEKARGIHVVLGPRASTPPNRDPPPPSDATKRGVAGHVVPIALGMGGLAALVTAGLTSRYTHGAAEECRSDAACRGSQPRRDAFSEQLVVSNVLLGAGLGAVALAAASFVLLGPRRALRQSRLEQGWTW